jgi:hypothetical protein
MRWSVYIIALVLCIPTVLAADFILHEVDIEIVNASIWGMDSYSWIGYRYPTDTIAFPVPVLRNHGPDSLNTQDIEFYICDGEDNLGRFHCKQAPGIFIGAGETFRCDANQTGLELSTGEHEITLQLINVDSFDFTQMIQHKESNQTNNNHTFGLEIVETRDNCRECQVNLVASQYMILDSDRQEIGNRFVDESRISIIPRISNLGFDTFRFDSLQYTIIDSEGNHKFTGECRSDFRIGPYDSIMCTSAEQDIFIISGEHDLTLRVLTPESYQDSAYQELDSRNNNRTIRVEAAPSGYAYLRITTEPDDAYIFIDNKLTPEAGQGEPYRIQAGFHMIRVS